MGRKKKTTPGPSLTPSSPSTATKTKSTSSSAPAPAALKPLEHAAKSLKLVGDRETLLPLDIYSRLSINPLKLTLKALEYLKQEDPTSDSEDDDVIEFDIRPRFYFVSNLCLVCMKQSTLVCESCKMVSYCCEKHRKDNIPKHKSLCKIFSEICASKEGLYLAKDLPPDHYRIFRIKFIDIIEHAVKRELDLWEKEIILYPRVCRKCHNFGEGLRLCEVCGIDFYCPGHEKEHLEWCREFEVLKRILTIQHERGGYADTEIPNRVYPKPHVLPDDFDVLTTDVFSGSKSARLYHRNMDCQTYASLSHVSTVPLTTLYGVQKSLEDWQSRQELTVHVVGAEFQFECTNFRVWEKLFLHFLPNLKRLNLVLVGPELQMPPVPLDLLGKINLCMECKRAQRQVRVSFHPRTLYHDYCICRRYVKADVVCLFNPGLYRETGFNGRDTWPQTIKEFTGARVPVIVTSYTEHEIPRDIDRIKAIADVEVLLEPKRNPYASLKPDRNFVSDDTVPLIYKNYYISIVRGKAT